MTTEQGTRPSGKTEKLTRLGIWIGVISAFVLVGLGVIEWRIGHGAFFGTGNPQLGDWGNYGSYLQGTTASLWSLAGFVMIFVAFLAQKQQLLRQDVELDEQRQQFRLQYESIKRQNFESSFFQLLNNHTHILMAMTYSVGRGTAIGRGCFNAWHHELKHWDDLEKKTPLEKYQTLSNGAQGQQLGHYFRNLYHLIKFVKDSDVEDKRRYTSLVRATLSQYELVLLFYNCLALLGEKFKPLVEEFGLLENLNHGLLLDQQDKSGYHASAFT